jgi:hypothetical protein
MFRQCPLKRSSLDKNIQTDKIKYSQILTLVDTNVLSPFYYSPLLIKDK